MSDSIRGNREAIIVLQTSIDELKNDVNEIKLSVHEIVITLQNLPEKFDGRYASKEELSEVDKRVKPVLDLLEKAKTTAFLSIIGLVIVAVLYFVLKEADFFLGKL